MFIRPISIFSCLLLLGGCKLTLVTEPGGFITSESQLYNCDAASSCELNLPEGAFTDSFAAQANPGFRFAGWRGLCREGIDAFSPTCGVSANEKIRELDVEGRLVARFSQDLVGTWIQGSFDDPDNLVLFTFYPSGYAVVARSALDAPAATNPTGGFGYSSYTYDSAVIPSTVSANLDVQFLQSSIGEASGFYPDPLITNLDNLIFAAKGVAVSDDIVTFTIRNRFGGGEFGAERINFKDDEAPLQGTWVIGDVANYEQFAQVTFFNGFFMVAEYCESNGADVGGGIQRGTYTWDAGSGAIDLTVLHDTLQGCGLYDVASDRANVENIQQKNDSALVFTTSDGEEIIAEALR